MNNFTKAQARTLILIELNEVNFDVVAQYIKTNDSLFPTLNKLLSGFYVRTTAEKNYPELEPWIQWVSVHSGRSYSEHGIFRLGDIVGSAVPQMFEQLERAGLRVGCVSAMNAENRLQQPAYFVPDPWTGTPPDNSWWSRVLSKAISQVVNDNAQARINPKSAIYLVLGLLRFAQSKHYSLYWKLIRRSRGASWRKALVLDLLLHDLHVNLYKEQIPNFSTIFLNAGAHIQHHYFLSSQAVREQTKLQNPVWYIPSNVDPIAEMLEVYDSILGEYLTLKNVEVLVATGLSQKPYDRIKYYYRLKDHASFLNLLGVEFHTVSPRMTRDFLIEFETRHQAVIARDKLSQIRIAGSCEALFGEIDDRGTSLFVTLTYPSEIDKSVLFEWRDIKYSLVDHVAFVAIKNGMHQEGGFAFFTAGIADLAPKNGSHVKELYGSILRFFEVSTT